MGEPAEHGKPEDTPGGRPDTPPGQDGEQPGNRPDVPPGQEDKPDKPEHPEEGEEAHPEHPIAEPAAHTEQTVEALLGWRDFMAVAPRRRSAASTAAARAALARWMRLHGHDTNGFYTMPQWQDLHAEMLRSTG
jgi:hypothetical protein